MPHEWIDLGNGRSVYRKVQDQPSVKRSSLPCPRLALDALPEPLRSGADGKMYTSKSALRASYLPSGNPQGIRYNEVGNETIPHSPIAPEKHRGQIQKSVRDAVNHVKLTS